MDSIPQQRCTKCGEEKPATLEYFYKHGQMDRLHYWCKVCFKKQANSRYSKTKDKVKKRHSTPEYKAYHAEYERKRRERPDVIEQMKAYRKRIYAIPEIRARYLEYAKKSYNRRKGTELFRKYRLDYARQYRAKNPDKTFIVYKKYRARKKELPFNWTYFDETRCLEYFHYTCAICGSQLRDLFGKIRLNFDHWIPLNDKRPDNPGTVPGNMLPLCSSCNHSKNDTNAVEWLTQRYGVRKTKSIMKRIQVYFDWIKQQKID